jgi:hypothetical protein
VTVFIDDIVIYAFCFVVLQFFQPDVERSMRGIELASQMKGVSDVSLNVTFRE